jgi:hypothetical protein
LIKLASANIPSYSFRFKLLNETSEEMLIILHHSTPVLPFSIPSVLPRKENGIYSSICTCFVPESRLLVVQGGSSLCSLQAEILQSKANLQHEIRMYSSSTGTENGICMHLSACIQWLPDKKKRFLKPGYGLRTRWYSMVFGHTQSTYRVVFERFIYRVVGL